MIYQSFLLKNQVLSLCMKIIHSVVVVGIYYGFLITFSIGPSSLLLFLFVGSKQEKERTEKISATTGFVTGQLIMFISIFSTPLHLALNRPYTIIFLALPYLLLNFFWNNQKDSFNYGYTHRKNSMHNFNIQCIFLNNIIFQLFNLFLLPSSILARVLNIFLFRCNKKMLFVTSSFIGWLIGLIFMKWVFGLGYLCSQNIFTNRSNSLIFFRRNFLSGININNLDISIILFNTFPKNLTKVVGSNTYYRLVKNLVSELRNNMIRIFSIILFITCVYYLVRIPSPILMRQKRKEMEIEEKGKKSKEEKKKEIETTEIKKELQISTEYIFCSLFLKDEKWYQDKINETKETKRTKTKELSVKATCYKNPVLKFNYLDENPKLTSEKKNKDKKFVWLKFEQTLVTLLFDYQQWNRPLRYIKNNQLENNVRNEMAQYFFFICPSDGKLIISFTYSPSLLTFLEIIQKKISLSINSYYKQNDWKFKNGQKKSKQSNDFFKRMDSLDNKNRLKKILENKTRICCNNDKKKYLTRIYDPFVNGPFRGTIKKFSSINETFFMELIERVCINKIHGILFSDYREFKHKKIYEIFDQKALQMQKLYLFTFISQFEKKKESTLNFCWKGFFLFPEQEKMDFEYRAKYLNFFLKKKVITEKNLDLIKEKSIGLKTICKQVPKWSYKLIDELEQQLGENEEIAEDHYDIRSRKAKRIVIFTDNYQKNYSYYNINTKEIYDPEQVDEVALIRYSQQSDFRRSIIKGTMRTQRRKTVIWELLQVKTHSPLFLDRKKIFFFNFDEIIKRMKLIFRNGMIQISKLKNSNNTTTEKETNKMDKKKEEKVEEKVRIEISEAWDTIVFAQGIRGCMLIIQSIFRKYIFLPLLIIVKNFSCMLFFQFTEWSEDFKEWNREMHIKCTYNGVQLSENEFPKNWLTDGLQIKILYPFCLKPWNRSRFRSFHMDPMTKKKQKDVFCFLTVWGMESEFPFGSSRKRSSFFEPIFKTLKKKILKLVKKKFFIVLRILKEKKFFLKILKKKKWFIKNIFFIKKIQIFSLSSKDNNLLFGLKDHAFTSNKEINSTKRIHEPSFSSRFFDYNRKDSRLEENKIKDLIDRTNEIKNLIDKIIKDQKKKEFIRTIPDKKNSKKNTIKKFQVPKKNIFLLKKAQLIIKSYFFIKNYIEKSYIELFLCIINSTSLNTQLFVKSTKIIENISSEKNPEEKIKTNQKINLMISILKNSISKRNCKMSSQIVCKLSSFSQTFLVYQFSKIQVHNLAKFRFILQYHGTSFFIKNEIKDFFGIQGILHSKSKLITKLCEMKQWKNWLLRVHYHYDISPIQWFRLLKKWQKKIVVNQNCTILYLNNKCDFLFADKVHIHYDKKRTASKELSLSSNKKNKENLKNNFDQILYPFLNYEYKNFTIKKKSSLHARLQKNNKEINYNYNIYHKVNLSDLLCLFQNFLIEDGISDIEKYLNLYRNCSINFFLKKLFYMVPIIDLGIGTNCHYPNMKIGTNNSGIDRRIDKKNKYILSFTIHQQEKPSKQFWNWLGMNEEMLINCSRSNTFWFFPEICLLYNQYKMEPWIIPIKLLFKHFFNENVSDNKNINLQKKNINQAKWTGQGNRSNVENQDCILSNQLQFIEVYATNMQKKHRKKQYKNHTETELDLYLKRYFLFQLRWDEPLNPKMIKNIKVYCLLLRVKNPKYMVLSSIQRGEICLDRMLKKDISLKELIKTGILILEPIRLSVKKNRKLILVYQTVAIILVHKNKYQQINQIYQKKYVDLIQSIKKYQTMFENKKNETQNIDFLFVPENILSARRCREVRILNSFYSNNIFYKNISTFFNRNNIKKNFCQFSDKNENWYPNTIKNKFKKLKLFFWPNFRFEDLSCVNRYWFDTNNGSRFNMLRICINN